MLFLESDLDLYAVPVHLSSATFTMGIETDIGMAKTFYHLSLQ